LQVEFPSDCAGYYSTTMAWLFPMATFFLIPDPVGELKRHLSKLDSDMTQGPRAKLDPWCPNGERQW
jgi:hypothetical protein